MLEGIKSKITKEEEWLIDKEDRIIEIITMEKSKGKRMKRNENSCRNLWDNHRHSNSHIIGALEGEEREKGPGEISEEMIAENSPEEKENIQAQEAQSPTQHKHNEGYAETDIKHGDINQRQRKILKRRGKQEATYTGTSHKVISWFFKKITQATWELHDI